jgi:drug/metabolite transporter (DMT)-like permease
MGFGEVVMLIITVLTGTVGQYFLRNGAQELAKRLGGVSADNWMGLVSGIFLNFNLLVGLTFYAGAAVLYILILTRVPLSVLGPSVALQYVFAVTMDKYLFGVAIPGYRWFGLGLIACGVILVILKK